MYTLANIIIAASTAPFTDLLTMEFSQHYTVQDTKHKELKLEQKNTLSNRRDHI